MSLIPAPALAAEPPETADDLAAVVRSMLPASGWKLSVKDDNVILERGEKVGLYNSIGLPGFRTEEERRAYIRPNVRYERLTIKLWLGKRVDAKEYAQIDAENRATIQRIRKDQGNMRFRPDEKFLNDHPQYVIRPVPILDTGTRSIYLDEPTQSILPPTKRNDRFQSSPAFWDEEVRQECQGIIDRLGKQYTPYK